MLNLNKDHIAKQMKKNEGISESQAKNQIDAVFLAVMETLKEGNNEKPNKRGVRARLTIIGFGTFENKVKKARVHINPKTKEKVPKPQHNKSKFTEGKLFGEMLNE